MACNEYSRAEADFLSLAVDLNDVTLDEPSYSQLRDDRAERTRQAMKASFLVVRFVL